MTPDDPCAPAVTCQKLAAASAPQAWGRLPRGQHLRCSAALSSCQACLSISEAALRCLQALFCGLALSCPVIHIPPQGLCLQWDATRAMASERQSHLPKCKRHRQPATAYSIRAGAAIYIIVYGSWDEE